MPPLRHLATFATIGAVATVSYALIAESLVLLRLTPLWASLIAYAICATWSYLGHKHFTFSSGGRHTVEAPRFAIATLVGLIVAIATPVLFARLIGPSPFVAVMATCVLVPIISYVVARRFVFRSAA
jgi:putative flippase GtrA